MMTLLEEDQTAVDKVIPLKLLPGGKEPPKKGDNWLGKLKQWAVFTARSPISKVDLFLFQIREKYNNSTAIFFFVPKEEPVLRYVSTIDFSNEYELMDILDDGYNRTDLDRRLEVNADIKQDDTMVGETGQSEV